MSTNGYRVYTVQFFDGLKQQPLDFAALKITDQVGTPSAAEYVAEKATELWDNLYADVPTRLPTVPPDGSKPMHLKLTETPTHRSNRVEASFFYGREGSYPLLSRRPGKDIPGGTEPMTGRAAVRPYNALFHLPAKGNAGVIVGEQIGQTCGADHLVNVLNTIAHNDCFYARSTGERPTDGWARMKVVPVVDDQRIESFIKSMSGAKLSLTAAGRTKAGTPAHGEITIQQDISVLPHSKIKQLVQSWAEVFRSTESKDERRAQGAAAAGQFFEGILQDTDEFSDPVLVANEHGKPQHVRPEALDRLFIYPTEEPLDRAALRRESAVAVRRIVKGMAENGEYRIEPSSIHLT